MLQISRPRFWMYTIGPYLIGMISAFEPVLGNPLIFSWMLVPGYLQLIRLLGLLYFTFPANLLIYGVNDIRDYDTDKHNPKKQDYETLVTPQKHKKLTQLIVWTNIPVLLVLLGAVVYQASLLHDPLYALYVVGSLALFLFLGVFYSAAPIRAKAWPFLDGLFNFLYVMPALVSFFLMNTSGSGGLPDATVLLAGLFWVMAMHAYSAVPDITMDQQAGIKTVATILGKNGTLIYCIILYIGATFLTYAHLGYVGLVAGIIYCSMMLVSLMQKDIFHIYRRFPLTNTLLGFILFIFLALF